MSWTLQGENILTIGDDNMQKMWTLDQQFLKKKSYLFTNYFLLH